ncbi:MAG: hypothetical protein KAW12_06645 [Candidatus Aminicenantes bacterium]|nr:hypothetical protein [Candidatus Aminicenantes bacterium]
MLSVRGVYEKGEIKLDEKVAIAKETRVIVTFLEEIEKQEPKRININEFSFKRSREISKDYKGCFSDAVIEERRSFI